MSKLTFIVDGKEISFPDFLKSEKERLSEESGEYVSWKDMDEVTGISRIQAYVLNNSGGKANSPPIGKFRKIIKALGRTEEEFLGVENLFGNRLSPSFVRDNNEHYWNNVESIGEYLVEVNSNLPEGKIQKLSCPVIRQIAGDTFYNNYGKSPEKRTQLMDEIKWVGKGKYDHLELQKQVQNRKKNTSFWSDEETLILEEVTLKYVDQNPNDSKQLPYGTYKHVISELSRLGVDRSEDSITWKLGELWNGRKRNTLVNGSPASNQVTLEKIIDERIEDIVEDPAVEDLVEESNGEGRKSYGDFGSYGHQALVAYLMDPINYRKVIGEDVELVSVDFDSENTPEKLFELQKAGVENLETSVMDEEVEDFVDRWMRVDMLFRDKDGHYQVVEVKQNAVNKEKYANADKARQQLAAYTAVILDNIKKRNSTTYNKVIAERIEGTLVAYNIEEDLQAYLSGQRDRRSVIVDKDEVEQYIMEISQKDQEKYSDESMEEVA